MDNVVQIIILTRIQLQARTQKLEWVGSFLEKVDL